MKEIKLSNGRTCRVIDYALSVEIYIFETGENEALYNISVNADDCREFSFKENLEDCIDKICEFVALTEEDKKLIEGVLEIPLYNMSLDEKAR